MFIGMEHEVASAPHVYGVVNPLHMRRRVTVVCLCVCVCVCVCLSVTALAAPVLTSTVQPP